MVTALDHMTGGRAILGLGAGWFEPEHRAYGFPFGASTGQRLDWLDEAAELIRDLLDRGVATARGPNYMACDVPNDPPPLQEKLPLLIGGAGERKTLATVARYADAWNTGGAIEEVRHKDEVLREWCRQVGRDHTSITRTLGGGVVLIRDTVEEARGAVRDLAAFHDGWDEALAGTPETIVSHLEPYVALGFRTIHVDVPPPFDEQTMVRFVDEVRPALQRAADLLDGAGNVEG
jgi:alkanesulfonate monooxygenase SsuD/methylene tetrahydromethanopterin reductase-like flavin-dependent oxidoreductase (luciferase family)